MVASLWLDDLYRDANLQEEQRENWNRSMCISDFVFTAELMHIKSYTHTQWPWVFIAQMGKKAAWQRMMEINYSWNRERGMRMCVRDRGRKECEREVCVCKRQREKCVCVIERVRENFSLAYWVHKNSHLCGISKSYSHTHTHLPLSSFPVQDESLCGCMAPNLTWWTTTHTHHIIQTVYKSVN